MTASSLGCHPGTVSLYSDAMTSQPLSKIIRNKAYRIVLWQLVGVCALAFAALLINGEMSGFSVLMGGLSYGVPNLLFVWRVFRYAGAHQMTQFAAAFFAGEAFKLILSGIFFLLIVKTLPVSLLSVLVGFIGAIVSFWIVCMWQFSK
jgi:ATP synthase protein I